MTDHPATARDVRAAVWGGIVLLVFLWVMWQTRAVLMLVAFSVILAFALDPLVGLVERIPLPRRERLPRQGAAAIVVLTLVLLLAWLLSLAIPRLLDELTRFVSVLPASLGRILSEARAWALERGFLWVDPVIENARANAANSIQHLGGLIAGWVGRLFGGIVQILGLFVMPLLVFYLLAERGAVLQSLMDFVPAEHGPRVESIRRAVNNALHSYVRGQGIVCIIMGFATGGILAMLGFPVALLLGVVVGIAEIVPYLGFTIAAVAIAIAGYGVSPGVALLGVGIYIVLNQLNSLLVTPRVMSRYLKLHPFVVTASILIGAELLGPVGALLALPGAAVIQAVIAELAPPHHPAPRERST